MRLVWFQTYYQKSIKPDFLAKTKAEYVKVREQQARKKPRSKPVTIGRARDNAAQA